MKNQQPLALRIYLASLDQVNASFGENSRRMKPIVEQLPKYLMLKRFNRVLTFLKAFPEDKLVTDVRFGNISFENFKEKKIKQSTIIGLMPLCLPNMGIEYYEYAINDKETVYRVGVATNGNYHIELSDYLQKYFGISEDWYSYLFLHEDCDNIPQHELHKALVAHLEIFAYGIENDLIPHPHIQFTEDRLDELTDIIEALNNKVFVLHLN